MSLVNALRQQYPGIIIGPDSSAECVIQNDSIVHWARGEAQPDESDVLSQYNETLYIQSLLVESHTAEARAKRKLRRATDAQKLDYLLERS